MGRRDVARRAGAQGRTNDGRASKDAQQQGFKDAAKTADAQPKARAEDERTPQASASIGAPASPGKPASPDAPGAAAGGDGTPGSPGSGKKRRRRRGRGGKGRGSGNGGTPGNSAPNSDLHSPRESDGGDAGGTDSDADD
jgi:hypothetical protein